jgi:hypothetical protein
MMGQKCARKTKLLIQAISKIVDNAQEPRYLAGLRI